MSNDDNDGLKDTVEIGLPGASCAAATAALNPLNPDTDGDGYLDGAECAIGTNPNLMRQQAHRRPVPHPRWRRRRPY